jgi:hypothetical protein
MAHYTLIARINAGDGKFPFVSVQFSKNHRPIPIEGAIAVIRMEDGRSFDTLAALRAELSSSVPAAPPRKTAAEAAREYIEPICSSEVHDIRGDARFEGCLDAASYKSSQHLAGQLLELGSAGMVYPSVRQKGGTCFVCFRPALANNVRKGASISVTFEDAFAVPEIRELT